MSELRAVLMGVGTRGQIWRDQIHAHPGWTLGAVVDIDESAARQNAAIVGLPLDRCYTTLGRALDETEEVDAVVIATPHQHHVAPCLEAIDRGKGVLVEKPFAPSVAEAAEVVRRAESQDVPVVVGQNYRYLRWTRTIRSLIDTGTLGGVRLMSMQYYRPWKDLEPALLETDHPVLWGIGPHHLDLIRHISGVPISAITARFATTSDRERPGASLHALMSLEDGARVTYMATYESVGQDRFEGGREFYLRVVGDKATVHVFHRWMFLAVPGKIPRPVRRGPRGKSEEATLLSQLGDAIGSRREPECSGRDNLATVAALEACLRSGIEEATVDPRELLREALAR